MVRSTCQYHAEAILNTAEWNKLPRIVVRQRIETTMTEKKTVFQSNLEKSLNMRRGMFNAILTCHSVYDNGLKCNTWEQSEINLDFLKIIITRQFEISVSDLEGPRRFKNFVFARKLFCYLAVKYTQVSTVKIGKSIKKHHSTVLYSVEEVLKELGKFEAFLEPLEVEINEKTHAATERSAWV
jgi:chromosomal replication initiation ATPase DnaA